MRLQFTDRMGTNFEFNNLKQLKEFIDREMTYWQEVKGLTEQTKKLTLGQVILEIFKMLLLMH
ncbi:hypothetical protein SOHN41_03198 [Shewanella sp. HN-41]|nr:hypothetical protein SOHN41_03198 [Shewanella sp. HN-41]